MAASVNTRELAADILMEVTERGAYSSTVLHQVLDKYRYLPRRERAFLTRLVQGTLERLLELDWILNRFSKIKVNKMKPFIRTLLRMSVYQLKYMDAVPASAVCSEAVKLAEKRGFSGLKGFVNGVLRNISRNLDAVVWPDPREEPLLRLSVAASVPEWILAMWQEEYGAEETEEICRAFFDPAPLTVRTNTARLTPEALICRLEAEGISVRPLSGKIRTAKAAAGEAAAKGGVCAELKELLPYAFVISGYDTPDGLSSFQEGLFFIQDAASMIAVERAGIRPGDTVLDVCAAPGGKSLHAAEKAGRNGMVEARDLSAYKVGLINENIAGSGLTNIRAVQQDARKPDASWTERADVVIADLPCSGLGVLGRKPEIRYRLAPSDIESLAALQREILCSVQEYVKPGGTLLYSTCTISPAENRGNTVWFAEKFKNFTLLSQEQLLPQAGLHDGFYIAVFRKLSAAERRAGF